VAVIAFTSVAANLAAIIGGILVFRDPIGIGALAIAGRVIVFCLVIAGAAFMLAPPRAGRGPRPSPASRQALRVTFRASRPSVSAPRLRGHSTALPGRVEPGSKMVTARQRGKTRRLRR
jgi:hypothetical protein